MEETKASIFDWVIPATEIALIKKFGGENYRKHGKAFEKRQFCNPVYGNRLEARPNQDKATAEFIDYLEDACDIEPVATPSRAHKRKREVAEKRVDDKGLSKGQIMEDRKQAMEAIDQLHGNGTLTERAQELLDAYPHLLNQPTLSSAQEAVKYYDKHRRHNSAREQ